jgi:hypothetical protein
VGSILHICFNLGGGWLPLGRPNPVGSFSQNANNLLTLRTIFSNLTRFGLVPSKWPEAFDRTGSCALGSFS